MIAAELQAAQLAQRDFDESAWPTIRESRPARGWDFNVFSAIRATLMARTSGHSRIGDATEWHPKDKPAVAHRPTLTAERVSCGDNVLDFGMFEMAATDGKFVWAPGKRVGQDFNDSRHLACRAHYSGLPPNSLSSGGV